MRATFLLVRGILSGTGDYAAIPGLETRQAPLARGDDPRSRLRIELLDGAGSVLLDVLPRVRFAEGCANSRGSIRLASVRAFVPFNRAARQLRVIFNGRIVHAAEIPQESPEITHVRAELDDELIVAWNVKHPSSIVWSRVTLLLDDGRELVLGMTTDQPELRLTTHRIPEQRGAKVRVAVSDGVRSSTKLSEPLSFPARAPIVTIIAPRSNQTIPFGQPFSLQATVADVAGGVLDWRSAAVHWRVDDEELPTNGCATTVHPPGKHLAAVVSERWGILAEAEFTVRQPSEEQLTFARFMEHVRAADAASQPNEKKARGTMCTWMRRSP